MEVRVTETFGANRTYLTQVFLLQGEKEIENTTFDHTTLFSDHKNHQIK